MMKSKANQPNNFEITKTAKNLILALLVGMIVTFFMLIWSENFLNNDTMQTINLTSTEHSIYPKNGNREERAKWWCKSWKLNNNKCQTWIKKFSEVEDPYFDLDPAEFPSLVREITADDLNRSPTEFLIFQLY